MERLLPGKRPTIQARAEKKIRFLHSHPEGMFVKSIKDERRRDCVKRQSVMSKGPIGDICLGPRVERTLSRTARSRQRVQWFRSLIYE
jgi:hypothetical protein